MKKLLILILSSFLFTNCSSDSENNCLLTGKVIDRNSKTLILKKQTEDSRIRDIEIEIDSSGNFQYELEFQFVEAYELIFKDELENGAWRPTLFFLNIEFTLYPMERADSNKIVGSQLSSEEGAYKQLVKDVFYAKYVFWNQKLDSLKNINEANTDYANSISDSINNLMEGFPQFELKCIKEKPDLYAYSKFLLILRSEKDRRIYSLDDLKKYTNLLQQKFPNHPYNEISQLRLTGLMNMKVGGQYVDFTAKDSTGTEFTLSNIVAKNKFTLIDLWAPWCGPCIRKSRKVIPIYLEFQDRGFAVIGVVGGISSKEKYYRAIRKHKYPWPLLAEINNENNLWEKYYISKAGGGQFLVDNKGEILAINPSVLELRNFIPSE